MKLYAIREISEMTSIKPVTLRAWQRRYGLIQPERTETGHRLYTEQHLERIREIQSWLAKGVAIGKVKALLDSDAVTTSDECSLAEEVEALLSALHQLDKRKAEKLIAVILKEYPLNIVLEQFFYPLVELLDRVKLSQRSIQKALLQSIMISQLSSIVDAENKAGKKKRALFINLDNVGSLPAWISAIEVGEKGYFVTLLDGVDDISGLEDMLQGKSLDLVYFFSNKGLQAKTVENIAKLKNALTADVDCSTMIQTLHFSA